MSSILTNNSAMVALQTLKSVNSNLAKTQDQISTGKSVASSKDNSAVWSISKVMESDVAGFKAISDSIGLGESTVAVARKGAETVADLLTQIKGKIVASQEENVNRGAIQDDIAALRDQIKSVVGAAQFNGLNMLSGTDDVNVLASLDRASDGSVTASSITVARQDMNAGGGTFGTGTSLDANATIAGGATQASNAANTLALTLTQASLGASSEITIGGTNVTFATGADDATTTANALAAINALGLEGITATSTGAGNVTINSTRAFESVAVTTGRRRHRGLGHDRRARRDDRPQPRRESQ